MAKDIILTGEEKHSELAYRIAARFFCYGWLRLSAWIFIHFTYWRFPAGSGKWIRFSKDFKMRWVEDGKELPVDK